MTITDYKAIITKAKELGFNIKDYYIERWDTIDIDALETDIEHCEQ